MLCVQTIITLPIFLPAFEILGLSILSGPFCSSASTKYSRVIIVPITPVGISKHLSFVSFIGLFSSREWSVISVSLNIRISDHAIRWLNRSEKGILFLDTALPQCTEQLLTIEERFKHSPESLMITMKMVQICILLQDLILTVTINRWH